MSGANTLSRRLGIKQPVGSHGDVVLELQVRYANDSDNIRQNITQKHSTPRSTRKEQNDIVQTKLSRFLESAKMAANSGNPQLAKEALENLSQIEKHNSYFSMVGDYAEVALMRIQSQTSRNQALSPPPPPGSQQQLLFTKQDAENEIQRRKRSRFYKLSLFAIGIVCVVLLSTQGDKVEDPEAVNVFIFLIIVLLMILWGVRSCQQNEEYAKNLVDELYQIAMYPPSSSSSMMNEEESESEPLIIT